MGYVAMTPFAVYYTFKYKGPVHVQGGKALGFPNEALKETEGETLLFLLRRFHICSAFLVVSLNLRLVTWTENACFFEPSEH